MDLVFRKQFGNIKNLQKVFFLNQKFYLSDLV